MYAYGLREKVHRLQSTAGTSITLARSPQTPASASLAISKISTAWKVLMFDSTRLVCVDRVRCLLLPLCFSPLIQIFDSPGILLPPLHPSQSQKYLLALDPNF